jgi:putative hydrolase of the HAD superfamily
MQTTNGTGNRKIKAIIFDMDNTLFDFVSAKLKACKAVVEAIGKTDEMELVEYFLNNPLDIENLECIEQYLKDNGAYTEKLFETCCKDYLTIKLDNLRIYPGVEETLKALKAQSFVLVIVTDAFYENTVARLKHTDLFKYFDLLITADMTGTKKPAPDTLILALKKLELNEYEVIYVGDSVRRDIEPGNELGIITVHAEYGTSRFHELDNSDADYVVKNISEVLDIVAKLNSS